jgi:hypothetical protein
LKILLHLIGLIPSTPYISPSLRCALHCLGLEILTGTSLGPGFGFWRATFDYSIFGLADRTLPTASGVFGLDVLKDEATASYDACRRAPVAILK